MRNTQTVRRAKVNDNRGILNRLMSERVQVPGFPAIVVTREFLYWFLRDCGWCPCERGFGSMEYLTFGRSAVDAELTDDATRDRLLAMARDGYLREAKAA